MDKLKEYNAFDALVFSQIVEELSGRLADEPDYDSYLKPVLERLINECLENEQFNIKERWRHQIKWDWSPEYGYASEEENEDG